LLAVGHCPNYAALLAAVFVMGLGAGILDCVLSPIVSALRPNNRTAALNWLHSFYCVGAIFAVLAGTAAVAAGVGWRTLALALIPMPAAVGVAFGFLRVPPLVAAGAPARFRELAVRPFFLVAVVAIFLAGATELGMAQWLPVYAEKSLGFSPPAAGLALVAFSVAMTLGRMVMGTLGRWYTPYTLMLVGCAGTVAFFLVGCFAPWPGVAVTGCVVAGFTGSALWPSMLAATADRYPNGGATMYGVLAALGNAGGVFMPWVVGVLADAATMRLALASAGVCPLLMFGCVLWMRGRASRP
jgi:fucose permease